MITSIMFVDVQALQARVGGSPAPALLVRELAHTMHGLSRRFALMNAYCAPSIDLATRSAYRNAGFAIIDTAGTDETLIRITLDLDACLGAGQHYQEAILLGRSNYAPLARMAQARNVMVSVSDRPDLPASLEALADGIIDLDEIIAAKTAPQARKADPVKAEATPEPEAEAAPQDDSGGDPWPTPDPDPKTEPVLVATATTTGLVAAGLVATSDSTVEAATDADLEAALEAEIGEAALDGVEAGVIEPADPADVAPVLAQDTAANDDGTRTDSEADDPLNDEVDALLSRLISDGLGGSGKDARALDIVPER